MIQDKQIAIVGGGPGGLTLARLLQQKGFQVKIYERDIDHHVRQQGATLDLHRESGLKALQVAGLTEQFKQHYRPGADRMLVTDKNAVVRLDDHEEKPLADFDQEAFRPEIDRGPLRDMLIGSLNPGTLIWNARFDRMEPSGEGWTLYFASGSTAYADLVVAADGANSRLRKYITDIRPVYSGMTILEGNIYHAAQQAPRLHQLVKGGKLFALGDSKSIILSAKGDGALSFYTGTWEDENWASGLDFTDRAQLRAWFKTRFSDWSDIWLELFGSDESYFIPRPMYHYEGLQQWPVHANLTMIGDAAHRMPPYAGEGVNMAMLDALELYEAICNEEYEDLSEAIHSFELQMCARAATVTSLTLEQMNQMHSPDGLDRLVAMFSEHN